MTTTAVIQTRTNHLGGAEHVVHIYDQDRPRNPTAENPCARYAVVETLGPFKTTEAAKVALEKWFG